MLIFSFQALAFETVKVKYGVYALVGDLGQRSQVNLGHNMTSGDYLEMLKKGATKGFKNGAFDAFEAVQGLDQSKFSYLKNYSNLSFRSQNALRMAQDIEDNK